VLVDQTGVACHTGRRSCFFTAVRGGERAVIADVQIAPDKLYDKP
jgi:phosphoribosyl-AMP cyclohydrolase